MSFRLEALTRQDRHAALAAVADAIGSAGGWIIDHAFFSDVMATINFAIPAERTADLTRALTKAGFLVGAGDAVPEATTPARPIRAEGDRRGQLLLRFLHGTGNLKHEIPAFE
jgi:hypothetical protein